MLTPNQAKTPDSPENVSKEWQVKLWNSIQALTDNMNELTTKVVQSIAVGEKVKQSVTYCLQTC